MGYSSRVLKMGVIAFDFQGHFGHFDLQKIYVLRMITYKGFELE